MKLNIGDSVIFMDSNLRGKITCLTPRVEVELEDGFVIQAYPGEFFVVNPAEVEKLEQISPKGGTSKNQAPASKQSSQKGPQAKHLTIDLHIEAIPSGHKVPKGAQLPFQLDYFRQILRANLKHRGMKISFVHGVGDGILKDAIRRELDEVFALKCTYLPGAAGVTVVTIR